VFIQYECAKINTHPQVSTNISNAYQGPLNSIQEPGSVFGIYQTSSILPFRETIPAEGIALKRRLVQAMFLLDNDLWFHDTWLGRFDKIELCLDKGLSHIFSVKGSKTLRNQFHGIVAVANGADVSRQILW
jgi:hypothetical protein